MRNIRTAAVAAATALTVAVGGTTVAFAETTDKNNNSSASDQTNGSAKDDQTSGSAKDDAKKDKQVIFIGEQEGDKPFGEVVKDGTEGLFGGKGSSKYFNDSDKVFYPTDAFGDKTNADNVPQWARYWIDGTVVAGIGALIGMIIAAANYASYNGWIKF
ncbi:hypothetical protein [uncultured Corynebacterium sp.]|uniref:hypothetical protein n=1 Tax=uncultured Corynebacterium sp. TaxID=159447 RepID=UPI00259222E3|nr:hypothetical protein [uncultured Corynebacterium sp.]